MDKYKIDKTRNKYFSVKLFLWILRTAGGGQFIKRFFAKLLYRYYLIVYGLEISYEAKIGKGLYIGHPYCITVNPKAVLGEFCSLHRGVLIGEENRGKRKGVPTIGNRVWMGINSVIIGSITIGDDVLIAPNSFVNCDVPSHSIVFGNPCVIKHRDNATEGYINL